MTAPFQRLTLTEQLWWATAAILAAMFAATAAVLLLTLIWTALTLGLFRQALSGRPFVALPGF